MKRSVLQIGGPNVSHPKIERINCDIAGILGHSPSENFYSYTAVIYWPDASCLTLLKDHKQWEALRRERHLPALHPRVWEIRLNPEAEYPASSVNWGRDKQTPEPDRRPLIREPVNPDECRQIISELQELCILRLRDIIKGTARKMIAFVVVPSAYPPGAFAWLSNYFTALRCSDDAGAVQINPKARLPGYKSQVAAEITKAVLSVWPWSFDLQYTEPQNEYAFMGALPWCRHWSDVVEEAACDSDQPGIGGLTVETSFPHINGAGDGKSLLFQTRDENGPADGAVWVMPDPGKWERMRKCVFTSITKAQEEKQVVPLSTRYMLHKEAAGWRLVYDGQVVTLKEERGLLYVAYILKHPDESTILAASLPNKIASIRAKCARPPEAVQNNRLADIEDVGPEDNPILHSAPLAGAQTAGIDPADMLEFKKLQAKKLAYERTIAEKEPSSQACREAKVLLDKIETQMDHLTGLVSGKSGKIVRAVQRAVKRFIKNLEAAKDEAGQPDPVCQAFAKHLTEHLLIPSGRFAGPSRRHKAASQGTAGRYTYEPPSGVIWSG